MVFLFEVEKPEAAAVAVRAGGSRESGRGHSER